MLLAATAFALLTLLPEQHPLARRSRRLLSTVALAGALRTWRTGPPLARAN